MSQIMQDEPEIDASNACRLCLGSYENSEISPLVQQTLLSFGISISDNPNLPKRICKNCNDILQFIQRFLKMCKSSETYLRVYCCRQETNKNTTNKDVEPKQLPASNLGAMHVEVVNKKEPELLIPDELEFQDEDEYQDIQAEEIAKEEHVEIDEDTGEYLYEIDDNYNDADHHRIANIVEHGTETENENDETADEMYIEEICEQDEISDAAIYIVDDSNSINVGNDRVINVQKTKKDKILRAIKDGKTVIGNNRKEKQSSTEQHVCELCGNQYKRLGALETHRQRHLNQRPFECEICGLTFNFNFLLERHMRKHTGDRPFICEYCDRKFVDRSTMSRHQKIHRNERAYKCDTCGKCFTYYSVLKTHIMSHTGEKPYCCGICGKGFHRASDLKNHLETLQHRKDPRAAALLQKMKRQNS